MHISSSPPPPPGETAQAVFNRNAQLHVTYSACLLKTALVNVFYVKLSFTGMRHMNARLVYDCVFKFHSFKTVKLSVKQVESGLAMALVCMQVQTGGGESALQAADRSHLRHQRVPTCCVAETDPHAPDAEHL